MPALASRLRVCRLPGIHLARSPLRPSLLRCLFRPDPNAGRGKFQRSVSGPLHSLPRGPQRVRVSTRPLPAENSHMCPLSRLVPAAPGAVLQLPLGRLHFWESHGLSENPPPAPSLAHFSRRWHRPLICFVRAQTLPPPRPRPTPRPVLSTQLLGQIAKPTFRSRPRCTPC